MCLQAVIPQPLLRCSFMSSMSSFPGAPEAWGCAVIIVLSSIQMGCTLPEHLLGAQQPFGGTCKSYFLALSDSAYFVAGCFLVSRWVSPFLPIWAHFPRWSMWSFLHNVSEILFPAPAISNNHYKCRRASFL